MILTRVMTYDQIICGDALNLTKLIPRNTVDLAIINLPYKISGKPAKHIDFVKDILKQIAKVTKIGGICCLIITNDIDAKREAVDMTQTRAFFEAKIDPYLRRRWVFDDEIIWNKSPRKTRPSSDFWGIEMVSFDEIPFSSIELFVRSDSESYEELNIPKRIRSLKISQAKKTEMLNSFWYIQPRSEKGFKDLLPKELIIRLIMLFSKKDDIILDPFAGHGITAIAAKTLNRHYFCIEKDSKKVTLINKRLNVTNKHRNS